MSINQFGALKKDDNNVPVGWTPTNVTASGSTVVKSAAGFLHAVTVNTTSPGTIQIYNNNTNSGTLVGTITILSSSVPQTLIYDVQCTNGITLNLSTPIDVTVAWV